MEIRVTRPAIYPPDSAGYADKRARQGHYFSGTTLEDAIAKAKEKFPDEKLDVEVWG